MKRLNSGFTLIELMVVVAIIGILAAVAIPQYQNYVARAQGAEGLSLMSGAKTGVAEYVMTTGSFPDDNETAGLATTITGNYVASVTVDGDKIRATFKSDGVNENITGKSLLLTATDEGGSVTFGCTTDIDPSYSPKGCDHDANVGGFDAGSSWQAVVDAGKSADYTACWKGGLDGRWVVGKNNMPDGLTQDNARLWATRNDPLTPELVACCPARLCID